MSRKASPLAPAKCWLPAPTHTFAALILLHLMLLVVAIGYLDGKAVVLSVAATLGSMGAVGWRWRAASAYYWEGELLTSAQGGRPRLRIVQVRRFGPWWRLQAMGRDGTLILLWVERWRLTPPCDWQLALLANGWQSAAGQAAAQDGVATPR